MKNGEVYDLAIYDDTKIKLGLTIYDNGYINFTDLLGHSGTFKIIDDNNGLDVSEILAINLLRYWMSL